MSQRHGLRDPCQTRRASAIREVVSRRAEANLRKDCGSAKQPFSIRMQEIVGRFRCLADTSRRLPGCLSGTPGDSTGADLDGRPSPRNMPVADPGYLKWIAASSFLRTAADFETRTFGIPYLGLIWWQPSSQYTPPSAGSGAGMGGVTATSLSLSKYASTSAISFACSCGESHFFTFTR